MSKIIRMLSGRSKSAAPAPGTTPGLRVIPPGGEGAETRRTGQVSTMQYNRSKPMYDGSPTPFRLRAETADTVMRQQPQEEEQEMLLAPPVIEGVPDYSNSQQDRKKWDAEQLMRRST